MLQTHKFSTVLQTTTNSLRVLPEKPRVTQLVNKPPPTP
jgi:hypothetical protein